MKRENFLGLLVYIIVLAIALVYGFTVLRTHYTYSSYNEKVIYYALYIIVSVVVGFLVTAILEELGHLLGAKVGGYKVISWCLLYFTIYKDNGKTKVKFKSYDGLTGETKIIPNFKKKERPNPYPYLLYGTIFNVAWIIGCIVIFSLYHKQAGFSSDLAYFFLTMGIIASFVTIYNIIPAKFDSINDGYQLKRAKDIDSFNQSLIANNATDENIVIENREVEEEQPARFVAEYNLKKAYENMLNLNYEEAEKLIDEILENDKVTTKKTHFEALGQKIYIAIMSKSEEEVNAFYEKDINFLTRKEFSNATDLPSIRAYMLMSSILDGSQSECLLCLGKVYKAYKNVAPNKKHNEVVLYNRALDKIIEAHPKWVEVANYRIVEN